MAIIFGAASSNVSGQNGAVTPVDYQCRIMLGRATNVNKHFSLIFQTLSAYARKMAAARDKGDDLVDILTSYAESESYNPSARQQLLEFTHWMALIQDFRHISATRIMSKIIPPFHKYEDSTKALKQEVKKCQAVSEKSKHSLDTLEKIRAKSGETSSLYHATLDNYRQNHTETMHQLQLLRLHGKDFEENKLHDLKAILHNFVVSEMIFHCRALETYTAAARCLQKWNTEEDLKEFLTACDAMNSNENTDVVRTELPRWWWHHQGCATVFRNRR
ncbi:CBY1-interacting BAR domain-containing protein 2-like [Paramacrobiotus metropolitanus]|uniref:CBY1-interacting BAR domain-containing protein 2-like n=1 Tax=Paramacrobiotus metropolitanus TaxID=2943436 RepID=UPI0024458EFA|nr:CBY1-interacting BAR domain-containing protein 2-like [Paramacrobiotus metropolitanus]